MNIRFHITIPTSNHPVVLVHLCIIIVGLWVYPYEQPRLRIDTTPRHRVVHPTLKFVRLFIPISVVNGHGKHEMGPFRKQNQPQKHALSGLKPYRS